VLRLPLWQRVPLGGANLRWRTGSRDWLASLFHTVHVPPG
jgi:hypothetical protein